MSENKQKNEWVEEMNVRGQDLADKIKELIEQGNVRRLVIYKKNGDVLGELPLTASVIAGSAMLVLAPLITPLVAAAAFLAEVKIEVLRVDEDASDTPPESKAKRDGKQPIDLD
jgi:hypothetical protein